MITNIISWSLGSYPNKSLDRFESPVRRRFQSDHTITRTPDFRVLNPLAHFRHHMDLRQWCAYGNSGLTDNYQIITDNVNAVFLLEVCGRDAYAELQFPLRFKVTDNFLSLRDAVQKL